MFSTLWRQIGGQLSPPLPLHEPRMECHEGQDDPTTVTEFVRSVRRDAEAAAEAEDVVNDSRCCTSCKQKCPEDHFWFGTYRSDMCKGCVERITADDGNKSCPVARLSKDVERRLKRTSLRRAEKYVNKLEKEWKLLKDEMSCESFNDKESYDVLSGMYNENTNSSALEVYRNKLAEFIRRDTDHASHIALLGKQYDGLKLQYDGRQTHFEELTSRLDKYQTANKELHDQNTSLHEEMDKQTQHHIELQNDIERLQKGIDRLKQDKEKLKTTATSQEKIIKLLKKDNESLMGIHDGVQKEVKMMREELNQVHGVKSEAEKERNESSRLRKQAEEFSNERQDIYEQIIKLEKLQQFVVNGQKGMKALDDTEELENQLKKERAEHDGLKRLMKSIQSMVGAAKTE